MPIFFHSEAHLWIAYTLFFNGLLLNRLFSERSSQYECLMRPFEAQVIMSFALSLGLNGVVLVVLDQLALPFSYARNVLFLISGFLLLYTAWKKNLLNWRPQFNLLALPLYFVMFVVLFYNGGMIDQVSDAWWHMSLANKIGLAGSLTLEQGHLTGISDRYYPPLWHGNLALISEISDQLLPALWNAFTAWGGALKLMAYYLFGLGLFKDKKIALLGAVMFALLPGLGNSYMRVSAWPSHISYIIWFFSLYVILHFLDVVNSKENTFISYCRASFQYLGVVVVLGFLLLLIIFLHQFELLLFVCVFCVYFIGGSVRRCFDLEASNATYVNHAFFIMLYRLLLVGLIVTSIIVLINKQLKIGEYDYWLVLSFPLFIFFALLAADFLVNNHRKISQSIIIVVMVVLFISIDYQHFASLFRPELELPRSGSHEHPVMSIGWFGMQLVLPGWHLQLREGLLWSGVVAGIVSFYLAVSKRSPEWIFVSANIVFTWFLCTSPYFYQWLTDVLQYHSVWRFAILSFHQLAIAAFIVCLVRRLIMLIEVRSV